MTRPAPALRINRAPVLTLWAAVVAERLGHPPETALALGRFVAGASARAKARSLGLAEDGRDAEERRDRAADLKPRRETMRLLGRDVPATRAEDGALQVDEGGLAPLAPPKAGHSAAPQPGTLCRAAPSPSIQ